MLSRDEAVDAAAAHLRKVYPEKSDSLVMLPEECKEYPYGWAIRFDWKEHIETGSWLGLPFTGVVVVPHSGEEIHSPPTAFRLADYMDRCASGEWPPKEWR